MKCAIHQERDAIGMCVACGKAICEGCQVTMEGKNQCKECVTKGITSKNNLEIKKGPGCFVCGLITLGLLFAVAVIDGLLKTGGAIIGLFFIGSIIFVGIDRSRRDTSSFADDKVTSGSVFGWVLFSILLGIFAFPLYLNKVYFRAPLKDEYKK